MWLDTEWDFDVALGAGFACDFINGLIDALAVVAPEFAIEDVELGTAFDAACKEAIQNANKGGVPRMSRYKGWESVSRWMRYAQLS